jgi:Flp pilus assembly pilin Flp
VQLVLHREEGQGLAEYALILAFIASVVVLAVAFLGTELLGLFTSIGDDFSRLLAG